MSKKSKDRRSAEKDRESAVQTEINDETVENTDAAVEAIVEPSAEETAEPVSEEISEIEEKAEEAEQEYSAAEGTDASLLSEFAPKPINIPNVNLEKEKRRQEKRSKNRSKERKRVEARKRKGKKRLTQGQKVALTLASLALFLIFTVTMTGFVAVLSVRLATSSYAFHVAVSNMDTAEIAISGRNSNGEAYGPDYAALGMTESSSRAALVDMIRDNGEGNVVVTYSEILAGVRGSGMNELIENGLKSAADHLLMDKPYTPVSGGDIAGVIRGSSSLVRNLTGRTLTDEDYNAIAAYFDGGKMEDISLASIDSTPLRSYTRYSRNLLSMYILGALLLINLMLMVLLFALGRRNSSGHIPVGWSFIISGLAVIAGAILFRPSYAVTAPFLQTVLNNYFNFFTTTVVVIAGIFTVVGAFIFLIGNAASDRDED